MAHTRSEVTLETPQLRTRPIIDRDYDSPVREVVQRLAPAKRVPPRSQQEWHDIFRGDDVR